MNAGATSELDALRFEQKRRKLAVFALVLISPTLIFVGIDLLVMGRSDARFYGLVLVRIVAISLAAFVILRVARMTDEVRFDLAVTGAAYLIAALVIAVHLLRPATMITPYFFEVVMIVALYAMLPSRWKHQVTAAFLITGAGLLFLVTRHVDLTLVERMSIATTLVIANGVGIAIVRNWLWYDARERALQVRDAESRLALENTTAELRVLHDILPICSHCRQVRDGAGAWAELESYVRTHSETRFSHGICPDCLQTHYPDELASAPPHLPPSTH